MKGIRMLKTFSRVSLLAVLLLPLAALQVHAQQNDRRSFADQMTSLSNFLLQAAEFAGSKSQEERVGNFAGTVLGLRDNFATDLRDAVTREGLEPSPELSPEYQAKLQALQTAEPGQFGNAYFSGQVLALESMIQLMEGYQQTAQAGALKTFATNQIGGLRTLYVRAQEFSEP